MATYNVDEQTKGNDSGWKRGNDGKVTLNASRSWSIVSDTPGASSERVKQDLQSTGQLPSDDDPHPDNGQLLGGGIKVVRESPILYTATAAYRSPELSPTDTGNETVEPWNGKATVSYRSVSGTAEVDEDYEGNAIVNPGTNEPVSGVTRKVSDVLAIIKRPFLVFSGPVIRQFMDQPNSDAYLGFPPGEGLVQVIHADPDSYGGLEYYNVTAEVLFRTPYRTTSEKAWYHRRTIKGYYEVVTPDSGPQKIVRCVDSEKQFETQPVLLDASGQRLQDGANPEFAETKLYGSIAYSGMGFFT
jgi:hypothetical protein